MKEIKRKMVVLDDDPTGIQTVHDCLLITHWSEAEVEHAMQDPRWFFYVLTNTRAMTRQQAADVTRDAMQVVVRVAQRLGFRLIVVSRSDSCLRGHFPLETDVMRQVLTEMGEDVMPRTTFCPAFIEAGRFTIDGVHYMKDGEHLVPVSQTEFARDNVFHYSHSDLEGYIREKGADPADYQVVNAATYEELYAFTRQFLADLEHYDGAVVIRSSSSLPRAMSGISDQPLLDREALHMQGTVGCFVVGSHVSKTTRQLQRLLECPGVTGVELPIQRILDDAPGLLAEVSAAMAQAAAAGLTPVVFTARQEVRLADADARQHLGQTVSDFLVSIVQHLPFTPAYLVAKGGITSHDILTHGLQVRTATVMGQVVNSVPCIMTERFPYIIFPGNVGGDDSLREVYMKFSTQ